MLKHKKILFLSLLATFFLSPGCTKATEPYEVVKDSDKVKEHLVVSGELSVKSYDAKNGEVLKLDGLTIKIDDDAQDLVTNRKNDKSNLESGGFFVCGRDDFPTNTIIGSDYKATSNVEKLDFTFYIGAVIQTDGVYKTFVSQSFTVSITNSNVIKPWVWYTVTAVVIFGVVGMVAFTKHHKEKNQ